MCVNAAMAAANLAAMHDVDVIVVDGWWRVGRGRTTTRGGALADRSAKYLTVETLPCGQKKKEAAWTSKLENQARIVYTKHGNVSTVIVE